MEEIWKDIKGYEGNYQISNLGRVKSLERMVKNRIPGYFNKIKERILSLVLNSHGYYRVTLSKNGYQRPERIHRLVADCFVEKDALDKIEVNHIDSNKLNNRWDNLEWISRKEHQLHTLNSGKLTGRPKNLNLKNSITQIMEPDQES